MTMMAHVRFVPCEIRGGEYESVLAGTSPTSGYMQRRRMLWWFFTTDPHLYSVFWLPDGSKTLEQFRDEQLALVREHLAKSHTETGAAGAARCPESSAAAASR